MKPRIASTLIFSAICLSRATLWAADGSWSQATAGNQDWGNSANWLSGTIADGVDFSAIFSVNLPGDQSVTNAGGRTIGHLFFSDTDTSSAGGYNLGFAGEPGSVTLDVTSGRSVVDIGALGSGKKLSVVDPLINADGILKVGS